MIAVRTLLAILGFGTSFVVLIILARHVFRVWRGKASRMTLRPRVRATLLLLAGAAAAMTAPSDYEYGEAAYRAGDYADAAEYLARVDSSHAHYQRASLHLAVSRRLAAEEARASDAAPSAQDDSGLDALDQYAMDALSGVIRPGRVYHTTDRTWIHTDRDRWDDAHLVGDVPKETRVYVERLERLEDIPGYALDRCRVRVLPIGRGSLEGWVMCGRLE